MERPTNCDRCSWTISEEDPWTTIYTDQDGKCVAKENICEDCNGDEQRLNYRKTRRLTTSLVLKASLAKMRAEEGNRKRFYGQTYEAVNRDFEEIEKLIGTFGGMIWKEGLYNEYEKLTTRGGEAVYQRRKR